jgi:hypothetical protein
VINLDSLAIGPDLKDRFRAWARCFDVLLHTDECEWPTPQSETGWIADGLALLEPLQVELGPDYDVIYHHR